MHAASANTIHIADKQAEESPVNPDLRSEAGEYGEEHSPANELLLLKKSEENFRMLITASGDIIFRITPEGVLSFASPAVEKQLGYTQAELQEQRVKVAKFVYPQDFIRVMANIHKVIQGQSVQGLECRLMHRDGKHFRWYSMNCYPMYDTEGQFVGVGGIARDITSSKSFEEQIRTQNEHLLALNDIANIMSQSLDFETILKDVLARILSLLKAHAGGIFLRDEETQQLLLKRSLFDSASEQDSTLFAPPSFDLYEYLDNRAHTHLFPFFLNDFSELPGPQKTVLAETDFHTLYSIPLKSKDMILGILVAFSRNRHHLDEQERQFLQSIGNQIGITIENIMLYQQEIHNREHLEVLNQLKDEFVAIVSHDLRSPLTAILGTTEILLSEEFMDSPLTEEQQELVRNIDEMGRHQLQLVNDLLDLAKIESGEFEIHPTWADIEHLVRKCYKTLKILADRKNITIRYETAPELPKTQCDVPKIQQVINNLVSNAIKFTDPGGTITLRTKRQKDSIHVSVSDTGIGMEPDTLAGVFDKFHQLRSYGTGGERGTGLGLSICKSLIEQHGGRIWAESRPGVGSTFAFTLPIIHASILLIDDSLFIIKSLEKKIHHHFPDVSVISVRDGASGLKEVKKRFPTLIILDYMMPEMDGLKIFQELRRRYGKDTPPTIFLTSSIDLEVRQKIFELGAVDYLQKPLDIRDLLPRISRFL